LVLGLALPGAAVLELVPGAAVAPPAAALTEMAGAALADVSTALGGAFVALDWRGLGPASGFPWQQTKANTRPAAQGTRVTKRSLQAFPERPRISDGSVPPDVTY
jgi:hypothetical protein